MFNLGDAPTKMTLSRLRNNHLASAAGLANDWLRSSDCTFWLGCRCTSCTTTRQGRGHTSVSGYAGISDIDHVRGTGTSSAVIYCEVVISSNGVLLGVELWTK